MQEKKVIRRRPDQHVHAVLDVNTPMEIREHIKKILQDIFSHLLARPDRIGIEIKKGERTTIFELDCANEDFGRLIGAKGRNISALRTLVSSMAASHQIRAIVSIKNEERFFTKMRQLPPPTKPNSSG